MHPLRAVSLLLLAGVATACRAADSAPRLPVTSADSQAAHVQEVAAAGGVVDSILPVAEALRRFQGEIGERTDSLRGSSSSIDGLVNRWAAALSARDTAALNAMVIDRAEFAFLYYPDSRLSKPPYEAPPELLWAQFLATSDEGAKRLLHRFGGASLAVESVICGTPAIEGANRLHEGCLVRLKEGAALGKPTRLFGTILERDGRFKFVGFANAL
jgi:hypothetical protein